MSILLHWKAIEDGFSNGDPPLLSISDATDKSATDRQPTR